MFRDIGPNVRWLALSYMLWGTGEGLWIYIQSLYIAALGAEPEQIGLVIGLSWLVKVLIYLPAGWLADRFGARQVMIPFWIAGSIGVIAIAAAPTWAWLVPSFICYGVSGAAVPLSSAYVSRLVDVEAETHPRQTFSRAVTLLSAAFSVGLIFSPGLGGWLGQQVSLRAVFVLSAFWFVLSTLAVLQTQALPPADRRAGAPGYGVLLRRRRLVLAMLAILLSFSLMALVLPNGPTPAKFLEERRGLEAGMIGLFGSVNALSIALLSLWFGRTERPLSAFLVTLGLVWAGSLLMLPLGGALLPALSYVLFSGGQVARPMIESVMTPRVRPDQQGVLLALLGSIHALGTAGGSWMAGRLYASPGPEAPFVLLVLALPPAALGVWLLLNKPA